MHDLTAWGQSFLGGVLIGCAAFALFALNGRIAGISGILRGVVDGDRNWRIAFLAGLVAAGVGAQALFRSRFDTGDAHSIGYFAAAGLLVGIGTTVGGGCTSGHGVCGLSRLSPRSLVATLTFMSSAAIVVFVVRHAIGMR